MFRSQMSLVGFLVAEFVLCLLVPLSAAAGPKCSDLTVTVTASANNQPLPLGVDLTTPSGITAFIATLAGTPLTLFPAVPVSGTFQMSARFCEPEVVVPSRKNTVQLLVHGATENKLYWSGLGYPTGVGGTNYSWIAYASRQGYPTLAIDRVGSGNSSHPDPTLDLQMNLEAEILHQLILALKSGAAVPGRQFSRVLWIGHAYGSIIGNDIATHHPADVAAYVLTAYADNPPPVVAGLPQTVLVPASSYAPRFSGLPIGYLVTASQPGRRAYFWGADGSYDEALFNQDFDGMDTFPLGQIISVTAGLRTAPTYTGPVAIITGERDGVFCFNGQCGTGPNSPQGLSCGIFPISSNCTYFIPLGTGHQVNLHHTPQQSFKYAHDFLADSGF